MTLKATVDEPGGQRRCIVVAVDFGTTFSGVAWAQTARVSNGHVAVVVLY
jgi:hypothetical protein